MEAMGVQGVDDSVEVKAEDLTPGILLHKKIIQAWSSQTAIPGHSNATVNQVHTRQFSQPTFHHQLPAAFIMHDGLKLLALNL